MAPVHRGIVAPLTEVGKIERRKVWGGDKNQGFSFGHIKFEMPPGHLSRPKSGVPGKSLRMRI